MRHAKWFQTTPDDRHKYLQDTPVIVFCSAASLGRDVCRIQIGVSTNRNALLYFDPRTNCEEQWRQDASKRGLLAWLGRFCPSMVRP